MQDLDYLDVVYFAYRADGSIDCLNPKAARHVIHHEIADLTLEHFVPAKKLEHLKMGLEQVIENIMPPEATLGMLPKKVVTLEQILGLRYRVIGESTEGSFEGVLIAINDITAKTAQNATHEREFQRLRTLVKILKSKSAFVTFVNDYFSDCARLKEEPETKEALRILHTLKGNSSAYSLDDIARTIHGMEDQSTSEIAQFGAAAFFVQVAFELEACLDSFLAENYAVIGVDRFDQKDHYEVTKSQFATLEKIISILPDSSNLEALRAQISVLKKQPIGELFSTYEDTIDRIGDRSGKKIRFQLEGEDTRVYIRTITPVTNQLIHVIRNACDHGIEDPADRMDRGKPDFGTILMTIVDLGEDIQITIRDDGGGINRDALVSKAVEKSLLKPEEASKLSDQEAFQLLFHDGLSTAQAVSQTSGRGVGMAALKQEVESIGGKIEITSTTGDGSEFRFTIPVVAPEDDDDQEQESGRLVWNESLSVGIDDMDDQHKVLIEYIDKLTELSDRHIAGRDIDSAEVEALFARIIDYTVYHFDEEETLLQKYDYDNFDAHKKIHEKLKAQITEMRASYSEQGVALLPRIVLFLNGWLRGHILKTDRKYGKYITSHYVVWNNSLKTGVPEMDNQHALLVDVLNVIKDIYMDAEEGKLESIGRIRQQLHELQKYAREHFRDEEAMLEKCGYPDLDRHRKLHAMLLQKAEQIERDFDDNARDSLHDLVKSIETWIIHHIVTEDHKYVDYLNASIKTAS